MFSYMLETASPLSPDIFANHVSDTIIDYT